METPPHGEEQAQAIDLLKLDYEVARSVVDKFDSQLFTIRNWAVTTTGAIAALAVTVEQPFVLLVGLAPPILFAFLELRYQIYCDDMIAHSHYLESQIHRVVLEGRTPDPDYQFGIRGRIQRPQLRRMARRFVTERVTLTFYGGLLLILIVGLAVYAASTS